VGIYGLIKLAMIANTFFTLLNSYATWAATTATTTNTAAEELNAMSTAKNTLTKSADTTAVGLNTIAQGANTTAVGTNTGAATAATAAKSTMIPTLLAFGAAILMIGIGLGIMALGFSQLDNTQMAGMGIILIGLAIGAKFMAAGLGVLGATLAAPPVMIGMAVFAAVLISIGASIFMVGAGIGIAAAGVGFMAEGLTSMFGVIEVPKLLALSLFFGILIYGAPLMAAAGIALGALGIAMAGLSIALKLMNFNKLGDITSFMKTFEDFQVTYIDDITDSIRLLGNTIEQMDLKKTLLLEAVLATTVVAGAAVGAALAPATLMAGAVGGGVTAAMQAGQKQSDGSQGATKIQAPLVIKLGDTNDTLKNFVIDVVGGEVKVANA